MIYLGADHAGFYLKEEIKKYLSKLGIDFEDLGNEKFEPKDDYPDFAQKVAQRVAVTRGKGILFCGSGTGMSIAANKIKKIRAAIARNPKQAKIFRRDNNINILCLASRETDLQKAKVIVKAFLKTKFSRLKRHQRRLKKIEKLEKDL